MIKIRFSSIIKNLQTNNLMKYRDSPFPQFLSQQRSGIQVSCPHTSNRMNELKVSITIFLIPLLSSFYLMSNKILGRSSLLLYITLIEFLC